MALVLPVCIYQFLVNDQIVLTNTIYVSFMMSTKAVRDENFNIRDEVNFQGLLTP